MKRKRKYGCAICKLNCLINGKWNRKSYVATHQLPIEEELEIKEVIGPDTGLYLWQKARREKDWQGADKVKEVLGKLNLFPAHCRDHYEIHALRQ